MVHGIPDLRPLKHSDIINVDVTVYLDGFHGDTSRTFIVGLENEEERGMIREEYKTLVQVARQALWEGIKVCAPGVPLRSKF